MTRYVRYLVLLCMLAFGAIGMHAQTTTTGAVNGVITDQSGAVIPNVDVTITNLATGGVTKAKSGPSGAYRFDLLEPGNYEINVDHPGFEKLKSTIRVDDAKVLAANLKLTIGSDQQTIDVQSVGALIEAENGNVSTTIGTTQMEEVPNSGNNLLFEARITPGYNNVDFGVVGNTSYQIDGENFNDPYNNANNSGASNLTLGLNDIEETSITGNGYSGQFGGLVGANVSFVSKQGGNRVHGNASWFWTGRSLIANTFVHKEGGPGAIVPRTFENANQWSGMLSGPITIPHLFNGRDKLFFLADAEGLRAIIPGAPSTIALPSANLQAYTLKKLAANGLTASLPYYQNMFRLYNLANTAHNAQPGNSSFVNTTAFPGATSTGCPTTANYLSPADLAGLGFTNTGGVYTGPPGACADYYQSTAATYANEALEIFRVDANIGAKDKAFIRYEHDNGQQPTTIDPINSIFNAVSIQPQDDGQFNETHTFGSKAVNNLILAGLWYGAAFGPANLPATLAQFPAQLSLSDSSISTLGGSDASFPEGRNIATIQVQDDFAYNKGAHTIKFGAKAYYIKENDLNYGANTVPSETVNTLGAFINGGYDPAFSKVSGGVTTYTYATTFAQSFPLKLNHPVEENQSAAYIEDDWKASHSFSLTAAMRFEHQGNVQCLDNCITGLQTPFPSLTHSASVPYNQAYAFNQSVIFPGLQELEYEPRLGFAYNPPVMHESLVVRGGYGIFYDGLAASVLEGPAKNPPAKDSVSLSQDHLAPGETTGNLYTDAIADNTAIQAGVTSGGTVSSLKASLPTAAAQAAFAPPALYTPQANFKMYYVMKWNLEIQKQFGKSTVVSINYLGNRGEHKPYTNAGLNAYQSPASSVAAPIIGLPAGTAPITGYSTQTTPVDPRFNDVFYYVSGGSNNYNGVVVTATQKFGHGGVITAGYTYGKIMDNGTGSIATGSSVTGTTDIGAPPDPYHPNIFYGPNSGDERHNMVLDYVYRLPFGKGGKYLANSNGLVDALVGGWEFSGAAYANSGAPFTVIDTSTTNKINSYTTGAYGASLIATYLGGSLVKGAEKTCGYGLQVCLSASQFGPATSVGLNGPRNAWRGPMYVSTDFNATKSIPLHWEGGRFEASAQAFNVLNHLNFAKPTGSLSSGSFAKITAAFNPSGIFSGVGGDDSPRIVQLKAKVVF